MKILIGFPTNEDKFYCRDDFIQGLIDSVTKDFTDIFIVDTSKKRKTLLEDFEELERYVTNYSCDELYIPKAMDRVVAARNEIVRLAKENHYDYVFFLDSDAILKKGQIEHMLSYDKDVVSAVLMTIYPNGWIGPVPFLDKHRRMGLKNIGTGLLKAYRIGFGGVLIKTKVFDNIKIRCKRNKKGIMTESEDFCFSDDCRELGIPLYVDSEIQIEHRMVGQWNNKTC